ncbi:MAG TPA: oligosaccharide flippase family protein [Pyrinomonadaceae bacterium]|nr:oligosaccharide flippase family protein [Pyrinomonadaceae bacterium]
MANAGIKFLNASDKIGLSLTARALWLLIAKILAFGFSIALPLLLVRRLSQEEFGLYKQAFLVVGSAITLLPLGFQMSAFYFLPREKDRQGQIVLNILLFHLVMASVGALVLLLFPQLLTTIFHSADLVEYAPLIAAAIFFWVFPVYLEAVSVAHQEARLSTIFIISSQLTKTLFLLVAAIAFGSIRALLYAGIAQGILQTIIVVFYLHSRFPRFWRSFDWATMRMQLSYALPFGVAGLLFALQTDLPNYFVSNQFDPAVYAIYAIGVFNIPLVGMLSESVGAVMIPQVSVLQKEGNNRAIIAMAARVARKLALVYLPLYAFLIVMGREFLTALFTQQYAASWPIFAINLTLLPLSIFVSDPIMRAYAEHRQFLPKLYLVLALLLFGALWMGTGRFGLIWAISAVVVISILGRLATWIKIGSMLHIRWRDAVLLKDAGKIAIAAAVSGIVIAFVRLGLIGLHPLSMLAVSAAVFGVIFLALILLLDVPSTKERLFVRKQLSRFTRPAHEPVAEPVTRS